MNVSLKPNFKVVGKIFGSLIKDFQTKLENLNEQDINVLTNHGTIKLEIGGDIKEITSDMVEVRISSKEGFNVGMENNNFIILNTELTDELIEEGIAREFISKVQNMRKNRDFNIVDRINIYYNGDELVDSTVNNLKEFIKAETLSIDIIKKDNLKESFDLNGHEVYLNVEQSKKESK